MEKAALVRHLFAILGEPQRRWVVTDAARAAETLADWSNFDYRRSMSIAAFFADTAFQTRLGLIRKTLGVETCRQLAYVLLFVLTAYEASTYGARVDVQLIASALVQLEYSSAALSITGREFLEVIAKLVRDDRDPLWCFHSRPLTQTCLALLEGRLLVEWYAAGDGRCYILPLLKPTMDYEFPDREFENAAGTHEAFETLVAALVSYAGLYRGEGRVESLKEHNMPVAFEVFGLEERIAQRLAQQAALAQYRRSAAFKADVEQRRGAKRAREEADD